jgi:hypothetical protein
MSRPFLLTFGQRSLSSFAETHGIPHVELENVYATVKRTTGERNPDLEAALVALAHAA